MQTAASDDGVHTAAGHDSVQAAAGDDGNAPPTVSPPAVAATGEEEAFAALADGAISADNCASGQG
jgi:hypothetical protein